MTNLKLTKPTTKPHKEKPDYKKVNKTRRQRGYSFEKSIVNNFNNMDGWDARRLGGSSTGLPDVVATNNDKSILYSIECKSGEGNILTIPRDQIERCFEITDKFLKVYKNRYVSFAFKFKGNKKRKLQYRIIPNVIIVAMLKYITHVTYNIVKDVLIFHFEESEYEVRHTKKFYHKECKFLESIDDFVNWRDDELN